MAPAPIFIGGMFKSGTTLLRAMLAQHSAIASGLETYWFTWDWSQREGEAMQAAVTQIAAFFDMESHKVAGLMLSASGPEAALEAIMTEVARNQGKRRWAEKTPGNIAHVDRIWAAWPDAQIIHIVRDPRDVFASLVEARKWDTAEEFAVRWCASIGAGERLVAAIRPGPDRYAVVRYEELTSSPEATMRRILHFLGEAWEDGIATFGGRKEDFQKVLQVTGKASTTLERLKEPLTTQRLGIWKNVLSDGQVQDIRKAVAERGCGDLFDRLTSDGCNPPLGGLL